jgi:iron complex transport system permease protein
MTAAAPPRPSPAHTRRTVLRALAGGGWIPVVLLGSLALGASGIGWPGFDDPGLALWALRLNRLCTGFVVGAALAASGVVLQALLRNPLADPYILGVSSGAGLGAALAVLSGLAARGIWALPGAAFAGGWAALALVYLLASAGRGGPSMFALLLCGVIVSAMASSLLMLAVAFAPREGMHGILWWMLGSVQMSAPDVLAAAAALAALGMALLAGQGRTLNALSLGGEAAHHLGLRARAATVGLLLLATLLTAAAVSLAGMIGFVGLLVPHAARAWVGPDHRRLTWAAVWMGGGFLVACDAVARLLAAPRELPIGVVTALIGGPFFLLRLLRRRREGWVE